ncbi:hypothetical protein NDU88_007240 [Pleurodeles waltl]|uniref:Uncharacterized protein n=1 Tax=Pleurodeles waltl TaxID=8319 RepID=A0AAV7N1I4_PLEWA|nr:hypothetical protein NDU88_007240 [Pleurodeles waltl]
MAAPGPRLKLIQMYLGARNTDCYQARRPPSLLRTQLKEEPAYCLNRTLRATKTGGTTGEVHHCSPADQSNFRGPASVHLQFCTTMERQQFLGPLPSYPEHPHSGEGGGQEAMDTPVRHSIVPSFMSYITIFTGAFRERQRQRQTRRTVSFLKRPAELLFNTTGGQLCISILFFCSCFVILAITFQWYFSPRMAMCQYTKRLQREVYKYENISHNIHASLLDNVWYQHMTEIGMQTTNESCFVCSLIPHASDTDRLHSSKEVSPNITQCLLHLYLCRMRARMQPLQIRQGAFLVNTTQYEEELADITDVLTDRKELIVKREWNSPRRKEHQLHHHKVQC